ncbi:hypothetical protein ASPWEDRAFT_27042 [Aspergillus wentii DTO 134E9]|uniref:Uncharacterized protein n=1 Tax=Aspergillus wentii DTO 134E9 TaxID=1073089 RepID=A0A1L9RRV8_ASPWE|nr:uncharacterized protein ASPWEDRAFT_27042 [Aspergillus wentii DTO 134E9]KAI9930522.1 hypothetical protein MW887_011276 [Aspergillus wentii]OJJ37681.1 hypothetical protein ASPWEDRAFT_27042 [Aspergillus wentii DTO 134E9]
MGSIDQAPAHKWLPLTPPLAAPVATPAEEEDSSPLPSSFSSEHGESSGYETEPEPEPEVESDDNEEDENEGGMSVHYRRPLYIQSDNDVGKGSDADDQDDEDSVNVNSNTNPNVHVNYYAENNDEAIHSDDDEPHYYHIEDIAQPHVHYRAVPVQPRRAYDPDVQRARRIYRAMYGGRHSNETTGEYIIGLFLFIFFGPKLAMMLLHARHTFFQKAAALAAQKAAYDALTEEFEISYVRPVSDEAVVPNIVATYHVPGEYVEDSEDEIEAAIEAYNNGPSEIDDPNETALSALFPDYENHDYDADESAYITGEDEGNFGDDEATDSGYEEYYP